MHLPPFGPIFRSQIVTDAALPEVLVQVAMNADVSITSLSDISFMINV